MAKEHWILKMLWLGDHVPLAGRLQSRHSKGKSGQSGLWGKGQNMSLQMFILRLDNAL